MAASSFVPPPLMYDQNVADPDVFDVVAGDSGDQRGLARGAVGNDHVADEHAPQFPDRRSLGPAHARCPGEGRTEHRRGHAW